MSNLIKLGEEYRLKFLPRCWEETDRLLRRRSWQRAVLAWVLVITLAVALGLVRGML